MMSGLGRGMPSFKIPPDGDRNGSRVLLFAGASAPTEFAQSRAAIRRGPALQCLRPRTGLARRLSTFCAGHHGARDSGLLGNH